MDYRYTWVRDASFSVYALLRLGFTEEAARFSGWLRERVAERVGGEGGPLNIMYRVDGSVLDSSLLRMSSVGPGGRGTRQLLPAAGSAAAARVALAHDLAPAAFDSRQVGSARSGVLLMKPWSGGGKVERFDLEAEAQLRGITPVALRRGDDLRALAEQAVDAGADVIGSRGRRVTGAGRGGGPPSRPALLLCAGGNPQPLRARPRARPGRRGGGVGRLRRCGGAPHRPRDDRRPGVRQQRLDGGVRDGRLPALVAAEAAGRIRRFSGYRDWATPEFVVDSGQQLVHVGVDGEALKLAPPLRFRSLPGALRVRYPLDAPGTSPAALRPAGPWRTASALVRVLGGRPGM